MWFPYKFLKFFVVYEYHSKAVLFISGAHVNAATATGDTPLSFACENGHTDVADVLLSAGAKLVRIYWCSSKKYECFLTYICMCLLWL